ncbi:MAG: FimV/HubP family polar landmark protein [Pseudomarimonas sp.]
MQKNHRLSLALALALGSSQALALGLGGIRVSSGLNEPLVAEIPIISTVPGEIDGMKVSLASSEAFDRVGIDRASLLPANLVFTVTKNAAGQPVVRVTTPNQLGEPILNFLLEVQWGRGRMLREYTVLLDPPNVAPARIAPAVTAPIAETAAATERPMETPAPVSAPVPPPPLPEAAADTAQASPPAAEQTQAPAPAPTPAAESTPVATAPAPTPSPESAPAPSPSISGDRYGPVASGDTLWAIAQQLRPDSSVSMNQTMLALLRANPDAFIGNNINRLKRGAVLRIPTRDELAVLNAAAAAAEVSEQARAWRDDAPAATEPSNVSMPAEPVEEVESAEAKPTVAPETDDFASRLELLPPGGEKPASGAQSGSTESGAGTELRADLSRAREQVATLEQENRDLRSRVTDLEKMDGDTKRLVELKDSQLAEAQRRLAELEAERTRLEGLESTTDSASAAEPVADATPEAAVDGDAPAVDDAAATAVTDGTTDADIAATSDTPTEGALDEMAPAGAVPTPAPEVAVAPVAEAEPAAVQTLDEPAPPADKPWYLQTWAMLAGLGLLVLGLVAFLLGRRRGPKPEPAARESIADRYEAATVAAAARQEEQDAGSEVAEYSELDRLLDAVGEQPNDLGRHLALVGHYYRQSDASGFEGAAEAMYAQLYDADHPSWRQVVSMGRDLLPDHPLFFEVPAAAPPVPSKPAETAFVPMPVAAAKPDAEDDWGSKPTPRAAQPATDATQNFSVDEIDRLRVAAASVSASVDPFDTQQFNVVEVKTPDMDFGSDADGDEEAATKLELARAYLDMGDVEGARGMLEEVVNEGNPGLRSEARRLLDEIR